MALKSFFLRKITPKIKDTSRYLVFSVYRVKMEIISSVPLISGVKVGAAIWGRIGLGIHFNCFCLKYAWEMSWSVCISHLSTALADHPEVINLEKTYFGSVSEVAVLATPAPLLGAGNTRLEEHLAKQNLWTCGLDAKERKTERPAFHSYPSWAQQRSRIRPNAFSAGTLQRQATLPFGAYLPHQWSFSASFSWGQVTCCWPASSRTLCSDAQGCLAPWGNPKQWSPSHSRHCWWWSSQDEGWLGLAVRMDLKAQGKRNIWTSYQQRQQMTTACAATLWDMQEALLSS